MQLTLLYAIILVTSIATIAWALIGRVMHVSPKASTRFCIANLLATIAVALFINRGEHPSYLHYHGGYWALLSSLAMYYSGICHLLHSSTFARYKVWLPLVMNAMITVNLPPVENSYLIFGIVFSMTGAWISVNSLHACYVGLESHHLNKIKRIGVCMPFTVASLIMLTRTVHLLQHYFFEKPLDHSEAYIASNLESVYWWFVLAYLITLNTVIQALTATRLVLKMRHLAERDFLTNCLNRRSTETIFQLNIERQRRFGGHLSCILFDLDHFKNINDVHGHEGGDEALKHVARITHKLIRKVDALGRYGGEEFLLLLPETDGTGAMLTAQRIRQALIDEPLSFEGKQIPVRASFGVAVLDADERYEDLVKRADAAMYQAKNLGRDRIQMSQAIERDLFTNPAVRINMPSRIPTQAARKAAKI